MCTSICDVRICASPQAHNKGNVQVLITGKVLLSTSLSLMSLWGEEVQLPISYLRAPHPNSIALCSFQHQNPSSDNLHSTRRQFFLFPSVHLSLFPTVSTCSWWRTSSLSSVTLWCCSALLSMYSAFCSPSLTVQMHKWFGRTLFPFPKWPNGWGLAIKKAFLKCIIHVYLGKNSGLWTHDWGLLAHCYESIIHCYESIIITTSSCAY